MDFLDKIPYGVLLLLCATLGLAPFAPPHLFEKIGMLVKGKLVRPLDWFDLFLHSSPWLLLVVKFLAAKKGGG